MKHPQDRGSIYITVIIILAIVLMLLSVLVITTSRNVRTSHLYSEGIRAHYIAQSGIALGIAKAIERTQTNPNPTSNWSYNEPEGPVFSPPYPAGRAKLQWSVTYDHASRDPDSGYIEYKVEATGNYVYNDEITVTRKLEAVIHVQGELVDLQSLVQKYD